MNNQQPTQQKDTIMEEFTFKEWQENIVWTSETYIIQAETYEQAKEKFLSEYKEGNISEYTDYDFEIHTEDLVQTGFIELYDNDGSLLLKGTEL